MKVCIIGGVAGGASCAARLRRMDELAEIYIFERTGNVSFANCGLPYYIGGVIADSLGLRANFVATSALLIVGGFIVTRFVHEDFACPSHPTLIPIQRDLLCQTSHLSASPFYLSLLNHTFAYGSSGRSRSSEKLGNVNNVRLDFAD